MNWPFNLNVAFRISIILLVVALLSPYFAMAGKANIEVLENRLANAKNDTAKANALIDLGEAYCSLKNDKALMYLQEAFTISTTQNYEVGIGRSLLWQGRVYYYKDEYPLAIKYLSTSRPFLEKANDKENLAFLYFVEGEIQRIRGDSETYLMPL